MEKIKIEKDMFKVGDEVKPKNGHMIHPPPLSCWDDGCFKVIKIDIGPYFESVTFLEVKRILIKFDPGNHTFMGDILEWELDKVYLRKQKLEKITRQWAKNTI